jgi:hypothetical protein
MSSNYIQVTYTEVFTNFKLPEGIDIKSKDIRYYIKYNTLHLEHRDGRTWEIDGEMNSDLKYPDFICLKNDEENVDDDLLEYEFERYMEFAERDALYTDPHFKGAYDSEYWEDETDTTLTDADLSDSTEAEVVDRIAENILNEKRGK